MSLSTQQTPQKIQTKISLYNMPKKGLKKDKESSKVSCIDCKKSVYPYILQRNDGERCKPCYDKVYKMEVEIIKPSLDDHRRSWAERFGDAFEMVCTKCAVLIDVFTFQSDYVDGVLTPMCNGCCSVEMRRRVNTLSREVWIKYIGKTVQTTCSIRGRNIINVFNFEKGHIVAASKGGSKSVDNLYPICRDCNRDMADEDMRDFYRRYNY